MSERIRKAQRRHLVELFAVMAVYLAAVFGVAQYTDYIESGVLRTVVVLAPPLTLAAACFIFVRNYRRLDERQQRIQANAAAITLVVAIVGASTLGFLKSFGVFAHEDDFLWFTPFLIVVWSLARRFLGDEC